MIFTFIYKLFQIHFPTNSLSHSLSYLNIISSFFLTTIHFSTFFYSTPDYYNRKKNFEKWIVAHQTWWATVHEPKKNLGIGNLLEWLFLVSFSIIEKILLLHRPLEMLLVPYFCHHKSRYTTTEIAPITLKIVVIQCLLFQILSLKFP